MLTYVQYLLTYLPILARLYYANLAAGLSMRWGT